MGFTYSDVKLLARGGHGIVHRISLLVVSVAINEEPRILREVNWLLDGQLAESDLVTLDHSVLFEDTRFLQDFSLELNGLQFNLKSPISDTLLGEEFLTHLLDSIDLLLRVNSSSFEGIAHASTLLDVFSHSID